MWTGKQWSARFAGGALIPLLTDDKRVAQARLRALATANDPTASAPTSSLETFEEAARRVVAVQLAATVPSAPARQSRLERWAFPIIGGMLVTAIRPGHVTSVLEHVQRLGRSSITIGHMRGDMIYVFGRLLKEEVVSRNPARGELVDTPLGTDDERKRVILRDDEFTALVDAPTTPPQLRMMAIVARAFGGMRTSDLRAWQWEHVDLSGSWQWADVPRPKTTKRGRRAVAYALERLELPTDVAAELERWHDVMGRPAEGPVFQFPAARKSYAADLRAALMTARIDRHELHHDTERSRRVDFHSFRRAYVTAIARAGLNAQTAMKATGHRQMSTHMLYAVPEMIQIPSAAVPSWAGPKATIPLSESSHAAESAAWDKALESFKCEGEDSNLHGSYPASTSIQSDRIQDGTDVHLTGAQPPAPTRVTEAVQYVSAPFRIEPGGGVVALELSLRARAADMALASYLRGLTDGIVSGLCH